ncbi:MAG: DUF429 domain-containing protein [Spirochaetota bacterium]|nr:DUF429 domain-containing protein [Spirochaetota bacterium]
MYYIGIDPSWSGKNYTAVVICDDALQVIDTCYTNDIKKIISAIVPFNDAVIGIDAPLIIQNTTGHRRHEIEFLRVFSRFGLGLHAVNKKRYPYFFPEVLYKELHALGFSFNNNNIFEVYPHATIMTCFNNMKLLQYKSKYGVTMRRENNEKLYNYLATVIRCGDLFTGTIAQAKGKQLKKYEDFLDALVCAYTVYYCMHKSCYSFGDAENGILLVPSPECRKVVDT